MPAHLHELQKGIDYKRLPDAQQRQEAVHFIGGKKDFINIEIGLRQGRTDIDRILDIENLPRLF